MTVLLTREQLYQLVWSESIKRQSKQIGISDVAIAKHCRKLNVPVPERGYWAKLQAGQRVTKPPLPPRDLGTPSWVKMVGTIGPELLARITGEPGIEDRNDESIAVLSERFRRRLGKVSVPRSSSKAHPAITNLLRKGEMLREQFLGRTSPWRRLRFFSSVEQRRLRIINGLFLAFRKMGWRVILRGPDARKLGVRIGKVIVRFEIDVADEASTERKTGHGDLRGRLFLAISDQHKVDGLTTRWEDRDEFVLEGQLTDVVVGIAVVGEYLHRRDLKLPRLQQPEKDVRGSERSGGVERQISERVTMEGTADRVALRAHAAAWRDADNIRAFVAVMQNKMKGNVDNLRLEDWVRWALTEADCLDPLSSDTELTVVPAKRLPRHRRGERAAKRQRRHRAKYKASTVTGSSALLGARGGKDDGR
jgi:hypothetical protein